MSLNDNRYHVKSGIETEQYLSINTRHSVYNLLLNTMSKVLHLEYALKYFYYPNFEKGE